MGANRLPGPGLSAACGLTAWLCVSLALAAEEPSSAGPALGQGMMAGEVMETSAILQARLTRGTDLVNGDLPGWAGVGRFELSDAEAFPAGQTRESPLLRADPRQDFILRWSVDGLTPGKRYFYRLHYGDSKLDRTSTAGFFRTAGGPKALAEYRLAVIACMNYAFFHGLAGGTPSDKLLPAEDRKKGYPALEAIRRMKVDYLVGTGDNVYYDHPGGNQSARSEQQLRRKWHEQFAQPRMIALLGQVSSLWQKDDHDFRFDDADLRPGKDPSVELGGRTFRQQLPQGTLPYRTVRISRDLQIWLTEGRDFRSDNDKDDGPDKTMWGAAQRQWLQKTLPASDAAFRIIISPTPLIGPDRTSKRDNHTNPRGFRQERDWLLGWLKSQGLVSKPDRPGSPQVLLVCGDRHWQYHSIDPSGLEEFSCGALNDENSIVGTFPGEARGSDPQALIHQPYHPRKARGGFLTLTVRPGGGQSDPPSLDVEFFDSSGGQQHSERRTWR